jgi:predicted nucleotidyltransferase
VRISETVKDALIRSILRHFPDVKRIFLFGSRTDDSKRGGDIDILVETPEDEQVRYTHAAQAVAEIHRTIGEQKIELVVAYPEGSEEDERDPRVVVRIARETGIVLWPKTTN